MTLGKRADSPTDDEHSVNYSDFALMVSGLSATYPVDGGRVRILRGLNIEVESGECVAIVGPAGSGKSTLLSLVGGLAAPTRGNIYVGGDEITQQPRWERSRIRRKRIGFLFQQSRLLPDLSVLDNTLLPLRYASRGERRDGRRRARVLLERVGLAGAASLYPHQLTEEQQYRVALARALVNGPVVLLADDPFAALDSSVKQEMMHLTCQLCREEQCALLCTTEEDGLRPLADRIVTLPDSEIIHEGFAGEVGTIPSVAGRTNKDLLSDLYEAEFGSWARWLGPFVNLVLRPAFFAVVVAVVITYLCYFGLTMAGGGRFGVSIPIVRVGVDSIGKTVEYLGGVLHGDFGNYYEGGRVYYWLEDQPKLVAEVLRSTVPKSAGLLFLAMFLGGFVGAPLGILAALTRHRKGSLGFLALSVAGVSIPSFFLGLLLQITEITFYKKTGIRLVPVGGFGWDSHLVLPVLVLAARPAAQIARVTFVAVVEVMDADFVRTAQSKGLSPWRVLRNHVVPATAVPILTALGTSLRFSLSSLPVVELLFNWPGIGKTLLEALNWGQMELVIALSLTLGMSFTMVNVILEHIYTVVDPRLRSKGIRLISRRSWMASLEGVWLSLRRLPSVARQALTWMRREKESLPPLINGEMAREWSAAAKEREITIRKERRRAWIQSTAGSLPFMMGVIVAVLLVAVSVFGPSWSPHDPYNPITTLNVNGEMRTPPFPPSRMFSLGTDQYGRDILSLLLTGARRTMGLAVLAMLARVALGATLGSIAGWFSHSLLDRLLMSAAEVTAAFPSLLLAMVFIYALDIQQGLWVFAVALCVVGWGEVTQFVRGQVMAIREKDYIEGALATGAGDGEILLRHVLPNLFPSLVVLGFLEMGSVLMMLGELGFIGVFIGGGFFTSMISGPLVYSDVPEWGAMIACTWRRFRGFPWATFYPALAFTISTLGFNFFGEGLRRLTERLTLNLNRLFNKYTMGTALGIFVLVFLVMEGTGPWGQYKGQAEIFNVERALADIEYLASPELKGRCTGTPELDLAAGYIAQQFERAGLQSAGETVGGAYTYFQSVAYDLRDYTAPTKLTLMDRSGKSLGGLVYRRDFAEYPYGFSPGGIGQGEIVYVGVSRETVSGHVKPEIWPSDLSNRVVLASSSWIMPLLRGTQVAGVLLVESRPEAFQRYALPVKSVGPVSYGGELVVSNPPFMMISPETANRILSQQGLTIEDLQERESRLKSGESIIVPTGVIAEIEVETTVREQVETKNIMAFMPGVDERLDDEAVLVVANYDGLGVDPGGNLYLGANDNASGVAVMLEIMRLWEEQGYRPKRTVFFVAWAGAERGQTADIERFMRARLGFIGAYRIVAVVELAGVGGGTGDTLLLKRSTSGRLTELFQEAAKRMGVAVSTRGYGVQNMQSFSDPDLRIPRIFLTWDGSNDMAHTPGDNVENIDSEKLSKTGRTTALALMVLSREQNY